MTINIFREDPKKFIVNHFYKLFYVWEKHFLFTYKIGPDSPMIRFSVYWGNILLLFSGLAGIISAWWQSMRKTNRQLKNMIMLSVILLSYISVAHVFSTSEERFSLPAYPIVAVFAGYAWSVLTERIFHITKVRPER
jgi:predicted MFS family arabinose efflux permease